MDKETVIAYILILLILFTMPVYYKWIAPPAEETAADSLVTAVDTTQMEQTAPSKPLSVSPAPKTTTQKPTKLKAAKSVSNIPQKKYVLTTDDYWITLSNLGGGTFTSIKLKKYPGPHGEPYAELVPDSTDHLLLFSAVNFEGDTVNFARTAFSITSSISLSDTMQITKPSAFTFTYQDPHGGTIKRTLTFYPNKYHVGLSIELDHFDDIIANRQYGLTWNDAINVTENNYTDDLHYSKAYSLLGDELVDIDAAKAKPGEPATESMEGVTHWVAVRNKYFTSIITPVKDEAVGLLLKGTKYPVADYEMKRYRASILMPYNETATQKDSFFVYLGPLDYSILKTYDRNFQKMMNFGWKIIRPISKGVLWAFTEMHNFIPNYGLVLILFGVLVKILVFPLTKKSYVSMKEMQVLQPKMKELREKYKDDSQKVNQEMMKLYKEHGVNPMGGCLPMMLQMPLLYALFIIFRSTIELRGAEFIWWIKDLSEPDTVFTLPFSLPLYGSHVNILPLIMGVTMVIQQRMTGSAAAGQQQKMMMWMMPIIFLLIFNNFPSGLNLYYALFNIMTIIQQKWFIDVPEAPVAVQGEK